MKNATVIRSFFQAMSTGRDKESAFHLVVRKDTPGFSMKPKKVSRLRKRLGLDR